jgi:aspartyl-tRNA(Asn)/glutamyl-tRNA(Gln) amidotransferase subunit A
VPQKVWSYRFVETRQSPVSSKRSPDASTVGEAVIAMNVIAAVDPLDPSSVDAPIPDFTGQIGQKLKGLRIGYARGLFAGLQGVSNEVVATGRRSSANAAYAIHEDNLRSRPLDYGRYTYQRMIAGATLSAADITQAFRLRRELTRILNTEALAYHGALLTATALTPAPRLDEFPLDWPPPSIAALGDTDCRPGLR